MRALTIGMLTASLLLVGCEGGFFGQTQDTGGTAGSSGAETGSGGAGGTSTLPRRGTNSESPGTAGSGTTSAPQPQRNTTQ